VATILAGSPEIPIDSRRSPFSSAGTTTIGACPGHGHDCATGPPFTEVVPKALSIRAFGSSVKWRPRFFIVLALSAVGPLTSLCR
jgi:hypothetical protein